jgi:hypothetical protein
MFEFGSLRKGEIMQNNTTTKPFNKNKRNYEK